MSWIDAGGGGAIRKMQGRIESGRVSPVLLDGQARVEIVSDGAPVAMWSRMAFCGCCQYRKV